MAEPHFKIQGVEYPVPDWFSFNMDESELLYEKAGMTLDQIDEDVKFSPQLLSTLMIVAYMRGNPNAPLSRAKKIIGSIQLAEVIETLFPDDMEEDAGPPALAPSATETPGEPARNDGSEQSSGDDSSPVSESPPEVVRLPTGTPESQRPPDYVQSTSAS